MATTGTVVHDLQAKICVNHEYSECTSKSQKCVIFSKRMHFRDFVKNAEYMRDSFGTRVN